MEIPCTDVLQTGEIQFVPSVAWLCVSLGVRISVSRCPPASAEGSVQQLWVASKPADQQGELRGPRGHLLTFCILC